MRNVIVQAISVILGFLLVAMATTAGAVEIPEGDYYIVAKHSSKALTSFEGKAAGKELGQSARRPGADAAQIWTITRAAGDAGEDFYEIRSRQHGTYLAGGPESAGADTPVVLKDGQAGKKLSWRFKPDLNSYGIELGKSGTTLNVSGANLADDAAIIVYEAGSDENAQWLLYPVHGGERAAPVARASEFDSLNKRYRIAPMPTAAREADRLRRMKLMDYQPSGVFVKKGDAVSVVIRGSAPGPDGLTVMIGPMNSFWDEKPQNDPQRIPAAEGRTDFTARRSGLIYFLYADSGFNASALPVLDVTIAHGGSPVPLYIAGQTSPDQWHAMLADLPAAPFVEMMSAHTLITATRKVYMKAPQGDPGEILGIIEQILGWYDELSGLDGSSELHRPSPLRVHYLQDTVSPPGTFDGGIYMYAGDYFVGIPGENMGDLLNPGKLNHVWSIWHETGHKYQQHDWTWDDIVETTVNVYSLQAQAHFGYSSRLKERDASTGKTPLDLAARYLARKTRDFGSAQQMRVGADDDGELWARLVMFDQLRRGLGEDFYPRLHRYYREHPLDAAAADDKAAQVQAFILRSSGVAGRDLTRFFSDWGVHIERDTADRLKRMNLPPADPDLSRLELKD